MTLRFIPGFEMNIICGPQNIKYLLSNKIYQVIPCLLDEIFSL